MKKHLFLHIFSFLLLGHTVLQAQTTDTVSLGNNYIHQVYYSLENDEVKTSTLASWDLAFDASGFGSNIRYNSALGTKLYVYPKGKTDAWKTVDTSGIDTWTALYDSDLSWEDGSFTQNSTSDLDVGWGIYNPVTHAVKGDSIYIIKFIDDKIVKLWIEELSGGVYSLAYANLDGSDSIHVSFDKSNYSGKNFGYYSITDQQELDIEPASDSWDLVFTKYTTLLYPGTYYGVTGVLGNSTVELAEINDKPVEDASIESATFTSEINTMGYNWKRFTNGAYQIEDSLTFYIKDSDENIWAIIFTEFGGSTDGNMIFTKELVSSLATNIDPIQEDSFFRLYPNPSSREQSITIKLAESNSNSYVEIGDYAGNLHFSSDNVNESIQLPTLSPGLYWARVTTNENSSIQKFIVR